MRYCLFYSPEDLPLHLPSTQLIYVSLEVVLGIALLKKCPIMSTKLVIWTVSADSLGKADQFSPGKNRKSSVSIYLRIISRK